MRPHLQRPRHAGGEERAVAAEGEERVLARVAAALARDRPDRADHVRGGDQVGAVGGLRERQAERLGDPLARSTSWARAGVQLARAPPASCGRVEVAEDTLASVIVGSVAAEVVADRARRGAGAAAARPAARRRRRSRRASRRRRRPRPGRSPARAAGSRRRSAGASRCMMPPPTWYSVARLHLAVLDDRGLGGGAAHVEGDQLARARAAAPAPAAPTTPAAGPDSMMCIGRAAAASAVMSPPFDCITSSGARDVDRRRRPAAQRRQVAARRSACT